MDRILDFVFIRSLCWDASWPISKRRQCGQVRAPPELIERTITDSGGNDDVVSDNNGSFWKQREDPSGHRVGSHADGSDSHFVSNS
jgi:hypothetical protein